jgi:predicted metal-dependent hydrolase
LNCPFPYTVIRSSRKTIALEITRDGRLLVRCSHRTSQEYIDTFVRDKAGWIEKHMPAKPNAPVSRLTDAQVKSLGRITKTLLQPRLAFFAEQLGVSYNRVTVRSQRSRWGSCCKHKDGVYNLNFNCLLALVPPEILDYVVVHELCHIREMNHSAKFWKLVETVLPDYATRKKWLREQGGELISRLPE